MDPITFNEEDEKTTPEMDSSLFTIPEGSFTEEEEEEELPSPQEEELFTIPEGSWEEEASPEEARTMEIPTEEEELYTIPEGSWEEGDVEELPPSAPAEEPTTPYIEDEDERELQTIGVIDTEGQTFTRESILKDPPRMNIVREYMALRNGVQVEELSDEEVYDQYVTTMRWVSSNEFSLFIDIKLLAEGGEEEKEKLGKAYLLFQRIEGPDSLWDFGAAVADYAEGAITSPSTLAGLGIGKLASLGASKAATKAAIEVAKKAAIDAAIKKGLTKSAAKAAGAAAAKKASVDAAKGAAGRIAVTTALADGGLNVVSDAMYQDQMINSGAQDEYSFAQAAFSAAAGVIPAGIAGTLQYRSYNKGLPALGAVIEAGNAAHKAAKRANINPQAVQNAFKVFSDDLIDWQKSVARGEKLNVDSRAMQNKIYESLIGSPKGSLGVLPTLMKNAGVVFSKEAPAIQEMISFYRTIDTQTRWNINVQMKQTLGMSMGQLQDILAKSVNTSATQVGYLGEVAREIQQVAVASNAAAKLTKGVGNEGIGEVTMRGIQYFQSIWRRSLVSHPATSAVNVAGWGQVSAAENLSFLLSGVSYGVLGLSSMAAAPFSATAKSLSNKNLNKAVATFKAVGFNLQTLLDPYATREAFEQILKYVDDGVQKQLSSSSFAGVENTVYGFDPKGPVVKRIEKYLDNAAYISLVKVQDSYTKSISFLSNLNRELLMDGQEGLFKTLEKGGMDSISKEIMDKATKRTMRDVMSMDYTKGKGALHKVAGFVEDLSNTPGLGMVFPFGRFLNNSLAFSFRYSFLGMARVFSNDTIDDVPTILAQAAVGTTFMYQMMKHEGEKYKKGVPWYVEEGEDGTQYDQTNLAPSSAYHLMGRIWYHAAERELDFDLDTVKDLFTQLGTLSLVYTADRNTELLTKSFRDFTNKLAQDAGSENGGAGRDILQGIMLAGDSILAGFTRPLEPINALIGTGLKTEQISDRSLYEGTDLAKAEATRYVDQIFALLDTDDGIGVSPDELAPPRVSATQPLAGKEPNTLGRLLGFKTRPAQTMAEKMLAQADFPEWRANTKTDIPELDRVINERVFNYLEARAEKYLATPRWKNSTLKERREIVKDLLKKSQDDVRAWIDESPGSFEHLAKSRRDLTTQSERLRTQAKKQLGIADVPDRKLSYRQIEEIRYLIDLYKEDEKAYIE